MKCSKVSMCCPAAVHLLRKKAALLADYRFVCNHHTQATPFLGHLLQAWAKNRWGGLPTVSLTRKRTRFKEQLRLLLCLWLFPTATDHSLILMSRRDLRLCAADAQLQADLFLSFVFILFYCFATVRFQLCNWDTKKVNFTMCAMILQWNYFPHLLGPVPKWRASFKVSK